MNRKKRFKQQRIYKLKIMLTMILFVAVILSGLLAVDLSKNNMLYGEQSLQLFQVQTLENDSYSVSVMNMKFDLNLKYIKRDIKNFKAFIYEIF